MTNDPLREHSATLLKALDFTAESAAQKEQHQQELRRLFHSLLEVLDSFDRLLADTGPSAAPAVPRSSVELVARQLERALGQAGVSPIACLDEVVDPRRHEIVEVKETNDAGDDLILEVLTRGYEWNGQPLRRPRVVVARNLKETKP